MNIRILAFISLFPIALHGQLSFVESTSAIGAGFNSGAPVVCSDMNGDGLDDLVRLDQGVDVCVDLQYASDRFSQVFRSNLANNEQWNLIAGDLNNDGRQDIVTSGVGDRVKVLFADEEGHSYTSATLDDAPFFAQASNLVDVNADGYLDIFVCNDDALNRLYINDGMGTLVRDDTFIDFSTTPGSDNSGNYGSTWADFDLDGDVDMYLSKCRLGVFDTLDPRRINMLFVNTDTGYVELASDFGLASGAQSWSADLADYDNDGDFDIVVTNHDVPGEFFENQGNGVYRDIALEAGLDMQGLLIQSIFRDFDNDGFLDLLLSGSQTLLYHNNGDKTFSLVESPFGDEPVSSFTVGDFNDDGFPDVYATYNALYNTPSLVDDRVWLGVPNSNNYIKIKAAATGEHVHSVGTILYLHGEWGTQIREIRAGESYGIATGQTHNFGLGSSTEADSLVVVWPDGSRDVYTDIEINTTLVATQGSCLTPLVRLEEGPFIQCGGESFTVRAPDGYDSYLWNNGRTDQEIIIFRTGLYHLTLTDSEGCTHITTPIALLPDPDGEIAPISIDGRPDNCVGSEVELTAPNGQAYVWTNGATSQSITVTESGSYTVTVTRTCLDATPVPVDVVFLDPAELPAVNDTVLGGGQGTLTAAGDSVFWYENLTDTEPVASGNSFMTPFVDTTTTWYAEQFATLTGEPIRNGMEEHQGGTRYNGDQFNGGLIFDVIETFTLDSVLVETEFEGTRTVLLLNDLEDTLAMATMLVDSGVHWMPLGFDLEIGSGYILTTDADTNESVFGTTSPQLVRSENGVNFPYVAEDLFTIRTSNFGDRFYYYFYDWRVTTESQVCVGERRPVELVVTDTTSSIAFPEQTTLTVWPNPVGDRLFVNIPGETGGSPMPYSIISMAGQVVTAGVWQENQSIDVTDLVPGIYVLQVRGADFTGIARFARVNPR